MTGNVFGELNRPNILSLRKYTFLYDRTRSNHGHVHYCT